MSTNDPLHSGDRDLDWALESLLSRTPGTRHAMLLSRDGLKLCWTSGLGADQADQLAAIAAGIQSLSVSASAEFGNAIGAEQAMVEFRGGLLLIVPAGQDAHLAVLTADDADVGVIGHNMNDVVQQMIGYLGGSPRQARHSIDYRL